MPKKKLAKQCLSYGNLLSESTESNGRKKGGRKKKNLKGIETAWKCGLCYIFFTTDQNVSFIYSLFCLTSTHQVLPVFQYTSLQESTGQLQLLMKAHCWNERSREELLSKSRSCF